MAERKKRPRLTRINVHITPRHLARLKADAELLGITSYSEILRRVLDEYCDRREAEEKEE